MFKIGDKVRVKKNYWYICKKVYKNNKKPIMLVRQAMYESVGREFIITGTVGNKTTNEYETKNLYLLYDQDGKTDGFAWAEEFLELATIV